MEKNLKNRVSIAISPDILAQLDARAGGNRSAYVQRALRALWAEEDADLDDPSEYLYAVEQVRAAADRLVAAAYGRRESGD